jgi:hypothetical protein
MKLVAGEQYLTSFLLSKPHDPSGSPWIDDFPPVLIFFPLPPVYFRFSFILASPQVGKVT